MAYSGKKYVSRRERKKAGERNGKIIALTVIIIVLILAYWNRVYLYDSVRFYF